MFYRTTSQASSNSAIKFVAQYNAKIINFQNQISSGIRLHRPSDDPVSFRQASSLKTQLQELQSDSYSIIDAETKLNTSVSQIQQTHDLIIKAKTLAQTGIQAFSQAERNALAVEVEGLMVSLKDISRSQSAGAYLYGGARTDQPPYEFADPAIAGATLKAEYRGSSEKSQAFIGANLAVDTYYAGDEIFSQSGRGEMLVYGSTGAKNGTGTDNIVGRAALIVKHSVTTYAGGSGVQPSVNSADSDTVLGAMGDNRLTINDLSGTGDFGTVTLNNGEQIEWTRSNNDLAVTGADGRTVNLDMSSIASGFNGTVDFSSSGTMSVDGGKTETAIDFSESQTVIDSTTNTQAHIDTRGINQTGTDHLEFPETSNLFQAVYELAADLRNSRELDGQGYGSSLDRRINELNKHADQVLVVLGRQSASLQTLQEMEFRVQDLQLEVETQINQFTATDIPETVLRMQNEQTLLEFTYAVSAQIASTNILDFLR